jgi:hypothetical protein
MGVELETCFLCEGENCSGTVICNSRFMDSLMKRITRDGWLSRGMGGLVEGWVA